MNNGHHFMFYDGLKPARVLLCEHDGCNNPATHEVRGGEVDEDGAQGYTGFACDDHIGELGNEAIPISD